MKTIRFGPVAITLAMLLASPQARAGALGTGFTYQAQLKESGVAVNDTADFVFTLYDADAGGAQIGPMLNADAVSLVDGQLTVELDFGVAAFGPDARWLEIAVRSPAGGGGYTTLSPRQPITAAPVALYALSGPGVASPWGPNGSDIYYDTGNVGIGMTTPSRLLDVAGSAGFDGIVTLKDPAGSNDNMQIDLTGGYEIFRDDLGAGADNTRFWLDTPDQGEVVLGPRGGASYLGNMRLRSKTVSFETDVSSATLKIANGNVGVGTSVPQVALHVLGTDVAPGGGGFLQAGNQSWRNIGIDDNEIMARNNGGVAPLYLNADGGDVILSNNSATGYLGVGTATPAARLHVQGPGGAFGGHVAVFENTDSANADGIAIKINNSSTNRDNNFVTFLNGQNNVAGRIEGFDLQNGDWIDPPPIPNLNLDVNLGITLNPAANWFSPGTPPAASVTGGEVPSLSFDWCNVIGINVLCGFVFDPGEFPLVTVTSTPPNITGSPFTFSTPSITFTPPTQQEIDALMCWAQENDVLGLIQFDPLGIEMAAISIAAAQFCRDDGVVYGSKGADYAEYLEKLDPNQRLRFGEVVGVLGGRVSWTTAGAEQVMVVSRAPAVVGNMPDESDLDRFTKVAFMGQVPVVVRGAVREGDYLVPSGFDDGVAIAIAPDELRIEHLAHVIGRAWSEADGSELTFVNVVVGVRDEAAVHVLARQQREIDAQAAELASLRVQMTQIARLLEDETRIPATGQSSTRR